MYEVLLHRSAIKDLQVIPQNYQRLITQHIDGLANGPHPPDSKKLKGEASYSIRVGVYRILYEIDEEKKVITIYRIKHRKEVYR